MENTAKQYMGDGFYSDGDSEINGDLTLTGTLIAPFFQSGIVIIPNDATYIDIPLSETTGSAFLHIHCETADDAVAVFTCVKAATTGAGSVMRLDYQNGTTSSKNLLCDWPTGAAKIQIKYSTLWNGGVGSTNAHYSLFMDPKE